MNWKDHYKTLAELQVEFKEIVKSKLSISDKTFYNKLNSDSWNDAERTVLNEAKNNIISQLAQIKS